MAPEEICLAPFEGVFYRGLITAVQGQKATVYFVDYGNTEQVEVTQVSVISLEILKALQCVQIILDSFNYVELIHLLCHC